MESTKRISFTGSDIKILACIIMLIDHIAAVVILPMIRAGKVPEWVNGIAGLINSLTGAEVRGIKVFEIVYWIGRLIGRLAFPIFAFLLVEGFIHTKDFVKYQALLILFAILSEPVFALAFYNVSDIKLARSHNVFLTLLCGLVVMYCLKAVDEHKIFGGLGFLYGPALIFVGITAFSLFMRWEPGGFIKDTFFNGEDLPFWTFIKFALICGIIIMMLGFGLTKNLSNEVIAGTALKLIAIETGVMICELLKTDYGGGGVLVIVIFYLLRKRQKTKNMLTPMLLTVKNGFEVTTFLDIPILMRYNGKRGLKLKYVFYIFYPLHLIILHCIKNLCIME
ncbi:MAG: conjugal transfer protein TraX [Lachnospiraceae bacterium]|nr:conjugal transfer protein TraX [Lachnospiraceae bacterium]